MNKPNVDLSSFKAILDNLQAQEKYISEQQVNQQQNDNLETLESTMSNEELLNHLSSQKQYVFPSTQIQSEKIINLSLPVLPQTTEGFVNWQNTSNKFRNGK